ncbi:DUF402 domain-containing protein [Bacillus sp. SM2101]|uniref:DUF402 domain-containing protein n=1 Tax=Bacillus sp. SM2101 TaxID=2805366 RepID=UPI001BDE2D35|nr:DUF402 domain-containing protein [Bacillus sp. SM2101]
MLKRKYADRSNWKRIVKSGYSQAYLHTSDFKGHISLLTIDKVTEPLTVSYGTQNVCIVDEGYNWLQQFPLNKHHSVTTMFNEKGEVVQWYIDICNKNGVENNIPYMDDLFLDLIVLPSGAIFQQDADELEDARLKGIIDETLYDKAWEEAKRIHQQLEEGSFKLLHLSAAHKHMLKNCDGGCT